MQNHIKEKVNEILRQKNQYLLSTNLKQGVKVLGVDGDLEILDTSDATATPSELLNPKTAYVKGEKIIGSMEVIQSTVPSEQVTNSIINVSTSEKTAVSLDGKFLIRGSGKDATVYNVFNNTQGTSIFSVSNLGTYSNEQISDVGLGCSNYYNESTNEYLRVACILMSNNDDRYGYCFYTMRFDSNGNYLGKYSAYNNPSVGSMAYGGLILPHPTRPNIFAYIWSRRRICKNIYF